MKTRTILAIVTVPIVYLILFFIIFRAILPTTESTAIAAIVGALAGAVGGIIAAAVTALVTIWSRSIESSQQLRNRVSSSALELTRMDYDLRMRALEESHKPADFLAPTKVYRELYRALLQLQEKDEWPQSIEELGLLSIFRFDPLEKKRSVVRQQQYDLLIEFLGKPMSDFQTLRGVGDTWDIEWRREKSQTIRVWVDNNRPLYPTHIQTALTSIANLAGTMITEDGLELARSIKSIEIAERWIQELKIYVESLKQDLEGSSS